VAHNPSDRNNACLLGGHGAVIAMTGIKAMVLASIGLKLNAEMLMQARRGGQLELNSPELLRPGAGLGILERAMRLRCGPRRVSIGLEPVVVRKP
jgi:hypothetical protein